MINSDGCRRVIMPSFALKSLFKNVPVLSRAFLTGNLTAAAAAGRQRRRRSRQRGHNVPHDGTYKLYYIVSAV